MSSPSWFRAGRIAAIALAAAAFSAIGTGPAAGRPSGAERNAGEGVYLLAPAHGSSVSDAAQIKFLWANNWYCTGCDGIVRIVVATDPGLHDIVYKSDQPCPAAQYPSCPTWIIAGPFAAGTYYWTVGVQLGSNPAHRGDLWSFTVVHGTPPPPPPPGGLMTFPDATGDSNGGPEIASVSVSSNAHAYISIGVAIPDESAPGADDNFVVTLDTDEKQTTGSEGADYMIWLAPGHAAGLYKFESGKWTLTKQVGYAWSNGPTFTIRRSDIGGPAVRYFDVAAETWRGDLAAGQQDWAPDQGNWWYHVANVPVIGIDVSGVPSLPRAGHSFTLTVDDVVLESQEVVKPDDASCTASLAKKRLAGSGPRRCTFAVPRGAAGRKLVVQVSAEYDGQRDHRSLSLTVRR